MIDWLARAQDGLSNRGLAPTDRTDETPITSVSSVPPLAFPERRTDVSSVSSVGVTPAQRKRILTLVINRCCDARGDDEANRTGLIAEGSEMSAEMQDDLIEHFTEEAIRWERATGTDRTDETPTTGLRATP